MRKVEDNYEQIKCLQWQNIIMLVYVMSDGSKVSLLSTHAVRSHHNWLFLEQYYITSWIVEIFESLHLFTTVWKVLKDCYLLNIATA